VVSIENARMADERMASGRTVSRSGAGNSKGYAAALAAMEKH
jgi:hypothetical protein